jgi:hypothetical protein
MALKALFWISIVIGFIAAALWFWSASMPIPRPSMDDIGSDGPWQKALDRSASLNGWAALLTGVSVLFTAIERLLSRRR